MIFKTNEKERAIKYLTNLFTKDRNIKIEPVQKAKTISQNAYIWLVFTHIAYETGNTKDDIYQYYLDRFPIYKTIYVGKKEVVLKITLSGMDRERTSKFIDQVVIDARQEGFDVPDPEDLKCRKMMDYYREKGFV